MLHKATIGRIALSRKDELRLAQRPERPHKWRVQDPDARYPFAHIGARLLAIRTLAGVSQAALQEQIGVNQALWSRYERGKAQVTPQYAVPFAARFRTTLDFIYRGDPSGVHPELLRLLRERYPHTVAEPPATDKDSDTGTVLGRYRAAIRKNLRDPSPSDR